MTAAPPTARPTPPYLAYQQVQQPGPFPPPYAIYAQPYAAVNDSWAWTLAIIPLLYGPFFLVTGYLFVVLAIGINTFLVLMDIREFKKVGRTDNPAAGWLFLVPVYLFMRGQRTGSGASMGVVSLVTWVLSMFGI